MIPVRGLMLDVFGLYDTRLALIVFHVAFQTGFCTLFMRNFFRQLPDALFDAARVDGWASCASSGASGCRWCGRRPRRWRRWCSPSSGTTSSGRWCWSTRTRCGR
jgi:hypothetical protein